MKTYPILELDVVRWGEARGIVTNSSAMAQAVKTLEETTELIDALLKKDVTAAKDAIGDIVVTLIMVCAVMDVNLLDCLEGAYEEIKDRKGYLTPEGIFVKEVK